jgi:hypothetical protein
MKQVFTGMLTLLLMIWAGAVYADPITVTVTRLDAQPANFMDLTTFNRIAIPNPGPNGQNFHVGIQPGIGDLHIALPGGFVFDHANFSQNLFSNPPTFRPGPFQNEIVDLDGGTLPFCTYFNISSTPTISFDVEPSSVPEPTTLLLLGTGLAGVAIKTRKKLKSKKP